MSYLCILDINTSSMTSFANIFSHSEGCLSILSVVPFAVQKLFSFCPICLFIFYYYRRWVKKGLPVIYVRECSARASLVAQW